MSRQVLVFALDSSSLHHDRKSGWYELQGRHETGIAYASFHIGLQATLQCKLLAARQPDNDHAVNSDLKDRTKRGRRSTELPQVLSIGELKVTSTTQVDLQLHVSI